MEKQKEALARIVDSLQQKYDETSGMLSDLQCDVQSLNDAYESSQADLRSEFEKLVEVLKRRQESMIKDMCDELANKQEKLKMQLKNYESARKDAEELISLAQKAQEIKNSTEFNQVALSIKERITMSSIFRLSGSISVTDTSCHMVADFGREESLLSKLTFLPVPQTPVFIEKSCVAIDNCVTFEWELMEIDKSNDGDHGPSMIESFVFQYRQVLSDQGNQETPWKSVENIKGMQYTIPDLPFYQPCLQARVQSWNKAVGGEFSDVLTLFTPAFNFLLDANAAHGSLKVVEAHTVEWDASAVKPVEARVRSAATARSPSPGKTASPKKSKLKDRFIGESYTILGNSPISNEEAYFEVTPHKECKTFALGITSNSLSRYDQLGRTPNSWCIFVSKWIQNSFVAKHNNKMKNMDYPKVPDRIGVYYNKDQSCLAFYDVMTRTCFHVFKQVKSLMPLVAGFSVWCGSLEVHTGLQVPSWLEFHVSPSPKNKSSVASSESSDVASAVTS